jgi:predicted DCC family thiol-disulfide oxidoreductase YuxK
MGLAGRIARIGDLFCIDVRSIALFRVLVAVTTLYSLLELWPDIGAFYSDQGVLPRADAFGFLSPGAISLYFINGTPFFADLLFGLNAAAALALLVGYRSRLAAFLCWVLYLSLVNRNEMIIHGGDTLLSLLLFWAMFLPLGVAFSVDSALLSERAQPSCLSIATIGLLLQTTYVYVFGALLKRGPEWIPFGSAVYIATHLDTMATPIAQWFRQFQTPMFFLTYGVWTLELIAPALLFFPDRGLRVRSTALVLLGLMHLGFWFFLVLGHFPLASWASLSAFVPGCFWDALGARYWNAEQARIAIYYDRDCGFCRKTSLLLREFFLPRGTLVLSAQSVPEIGEVLERETSWVVIDGSGRQYLRWDALVLVVSQSWLAFPLTFLTWIYGRLGLGDATYALIGRNRTALSRITTVLLRDRPTVFRLSRPTQIFLATVVVFCFAWNVHENFDNKERFPIPDSVRETARALGLLQYWSMFAPFPRVVYAWPIIDGRTIGGQSVDVFGGQLSAPSRSPPRYLAYLFPNIRWREYIDRITFYNSGEQRHRFDLYAAYLCRHWNERFQGRDMLRSLSITLMVSQTLSNYQTSHSVKEMGEWRCNKVQ